MIRPSLVAPILIVMWRARGRAGGAEHLAAAHHHLDRPAALARKLERQRLQVDVVLAAEAAADFSRRHLQLPGIQAAQSRREGSFQVVPLCRGPDFALAVPDKIGQAGLGLDIALMNRLGIVFAFNDDIGLGKALRNVATD